LKLEIHDGSDSLLRMHLAQGIHDFRYSSFLGFLYYDHWLADVAEAAMSSDHRVHTQGCPSTELVSAGGRDSERHILHR
jgi:hypothetical protein